MNPWLKAPAVTRTIFLVAFVITNQELLAQHSGEDRQISEIEAYTKFEISRFDGKEDMLLLSDSITQVKEIVNYTRRSKIGLGKVTEQSVTRGKQVFRTYYFNDKSKIFAIVDRINHPNGSIERWTYYFMGGHLLQVLDEQMVDVTNKVDVQRLYYWIKRSFEPGVIN